jgi:hypothetical protein
MIHAAGDVFAHSYVNNYAGDVFEITGRWHKDVERRHFDLEKYIDQRLPYKPDLAKIEVPSDLLVRTMVQTSYIPANYDLTHEGLLKLISDPNAEVAKVLAEKLARAGPAAHMTAMWAILIVAERAPIMAICNEIEAVERMTSAFRAYAAAENRARWGRQEEIEPARPGARRADCPAAALDAANARFEQAVSESRQIEWSDAALNERETWWKTLDRSDRTRLRRTYSEYLATVKMRDRMRAVRVIAPIWAADVRAAIRAYMEASLEAGKLMVRSGDPVPPAAHERRSMTFPYEMWRACYLPVFRGHPVAAADLTCRRIQELDADIGLEEAAFYAGIGDTPRSLVFGYLQFSQWLDELGFGVLLATADLGAPDLGDLMQSVHSPVRITRTKLNETFEIARNGQLGFKCVTDFIDADLGLRPGASGVHANQDCEARPEVETASYFDPHDFVPIRHAITLGKLALLGRPGVRQLADDLGGLGDEVRTSGGSGRYSIILDTVKSLDGSHQWQGRSLPMPRARAGAARPENGAGYPVYRQGPRFTVQFDDRVKQRAGFPFYRTERLRSEVFSRLFPEPFEGEILKRVEYGPTYYPYRPCYGDPFRREHVETERETICGVDDQ